MGNLLLAKPIPQRPAYIGPDGAPPGIAVDFGAYKTETGGNWVETRPIIHPKVLVCHTNAAGGEGNLQSSINWANSGPYTRTHAHYNLNAPVATKHCPTNRRSIANSSGRALEEEYGVRDVSYWSISIETADMGTIASGSNYDLGPFLYNHAELVALIIAYESIWAKFPIAVPEVWTDPGVVTHTYPFPYPHYTTVRGKTCPGQTKKDHFFNLCVPRARQVRDAWLGITGPVPPPTNPHVIQEDESDMALLIPARRIFDSRHPNFGRKVKAGETVRFPLGADIRGAAAVECSITVFGAGQRGHVSPGRRIQESAIISFERDEREAAFAIVPTISNGTEVEFTASTSCHIIFDAQGTRG